MAEKADIMGLRIDIVEKQELLEEIEDYLQNEYLNVIFMVTVEMIEKNAPDPEYRKLLEDSDYLLPAERSILEAWRQEQAEREDIFTGCDCFHEITKELAAKEKHLADSVYYIGKTKEEIQALVDYTAEMFPWLKAQGMYCEGMEEKDDLLVNEINAAAPDILVVALQSPFQEEWIMKNSTKLNARLCIGVGEGIQELIGETGQPGTVYTWMKKKRENFLKKFHRILFQKKLKKYQESRKK